MDNPPAHQIGADVPPPPLPATVPALEYDAVPPGYVRRDRYRVAILLAAASCGVLLTWGVIFGLRSAARRANVATAVATAVKTPALPPPPMVVMTTPAAGTTVAMPVRPPTVDDLARPRPADRVVYEEEPVAARKLIAGGVRDGYYHKPSWWDPHTFEADGKRVSLGAVAHEFGQAFQPPVYLTGLDRRDNGPIPPADKDGDAEVFLDVLTSPGGNRRLVLVELAVVASGKSVEAKSADDVRYRITLHRGFRYRILEPPPRNTTGEPSVVRQGDSLTIAQGEGENAYVIRWVDGVLRPHRPPEHHLRLYAGQTDPKDPAHFTIDYDLGGKPAGTIDGWLTDDDFLRFVPRAGKVEGGTWHLRNDPAEPAGPEPEGR